jgi:hypothetical protein
VLNPVENPLTPTLASELFLVSAFNLVLAVFEPVEEFVDVPFTGFEAMQRYGGHSGDCYGRSCYYYEGNLHDLPAFLAEFFLQLSLIVQMSTITMNNVATK